MKRVYTLIVLAFFLVQCRSSLELVEMQYDNENKMAEVSADPSYESMIAPYQENLQATMNEEIAKIAKDMPKGKPESEIGNLLADATRYMSEQYLGATVDIGVVNYGGIRVPQLSAGPLTLGNVYELMPFDNYVVVLDIDGETLQDFANAMAAKGGWPISGMRYRIKDNMADRVTVNGFPLERDKLYKLAISDYVANGGDSMEMLKDVPRTNTNALLRDAFLGYFKQFAANGELVNAILEGRVQGE